MSRYRTLNRFPVNVINVIATPEPPRGSGRFNI